MNAYVLLTVNPGNTKAVVRTLNAIPKVIATEVLGPYDIVVKIERPSTAEIVSVVQNQIRTIPGVTASVTCMSMEERAALQSAA